MKHASYTEDFYNDMSRHAREAAAVTVPLLLDWVRPASVADVGCGEGAWLKAFLAHGVDEIAGFDLPTVAAPKLVIPADAFHPTDFSDGFNAGRRYDLVLCLEVAEHLPVDRARPLVQALVVLGDVVVFSAAIPGQGGTLHLNEQWPQYWAELFNSLGYEPLDLLRSRLWNKPEVAFWYAQNMFVAINRTVLSRYESLRALHQGPPGAILPLVHPTFYQWKAACLIEDLRPETYSGGKMLRFCLRVLGCALRKRLGRIRKSPADISSKCGAAGLPGG